MDLLGTDGLNKFRDKLRSEKQEPFQNYMTELEFAGYYRRRGYVIQLEPMHGIDFTAEKDYLKVFFQTKHLYLGESLKEQGIKVRLEERLQKVDEPLIFFLKYLGKFSEKESKSIEQFVRMGLKRLHSQQSKLPKTFFYPNQQNPKIELNVETRSPRQYGYLGGTMELKSYSTSYNSKNIRRKISRKISRLPKNEVNVLVVSTDIRPFDRDTLEDALFGDPFLRFNLTDLSTSPGRHRERIFDPSKNTRLSAVIHYDKSFLDSKFTRIKTVYHNPFAEKAVSPEFFADEGVKQFVPIIKPNEIVMKWTD